PHHVLAGVARLLRPGRERPLRRRRRPHRPRRPAPPQHPRRPALRRPPPRLRLPPRGRRPTLEPSWRPPGHRHSPGPVPRRPPRHRHRRGRRRPPRRRHAPRPRLKPSGACFRAETRRVDEFLPESEWTFATGGSYRPIRWVSAASWRGGRLRSSAVKLKYGAEDEAFRGELVGWLADNAPTSEELHSGKRSSSDLPEWARKWQRRLFDAGYLVPGWPPELGGRNAKPTQQMIYFEELAQRELPRTTNPQALGIVAPSILDYGTDEQKERFV